MDVIIFEKPYGGEATKVNDVSLLYFASGWGYYRFLYPCGVTEFE
jgi:hypothetical protein